MSGNNTQNLAITSYTYDIFGYLQSSTTPTGVKATYTRDANGNQTGTSMNWVDPSGQLPNATVTTQTNFDALDRVISTVDQFGKTSQTIYDAGRAGGADHRRARQHYHQRVRCER
jgi:YD repeat-containing protein